MARYWPAARGVWAAKDGTVAAWINQEDHVRLISKVKGADLRTAFLQLIKLEQTLNNVLQSKGLDFARDARLGFLSPDPSNLGTGLKVEVLANLPLVSAQQGFRALCKKLGVQARSSPNSGAGAFAVQNAKSLGSSEVSQLNAVAEATRCLCAAESQLQGGQDVDLDAMVAK